MKTWDCYNCIYLDKTRRKEGNNGTGCYMYGCNQRLSSNGYICGWIRKDSELKTQGCSDSNKIRVGTILMCETEKDKSKIRRWKTLLYCGKVNGKVLLYCLEERKCRIVSSDCLIIKNGKIKTNMSIIFQTEEQFKRNKERARFYKRKYMENEKRRKQKL